MSTSDPSASRLSCTRLTQGVVTPNIVAATIGTSRTSSSTATPTIPAIAPAAPAITRREMRLSPAMSTTGYMSVISDVPT
jgi:hypothetical protein